jgi:hypothetical protein
MACMDNSISQPSLEISPSGFLWSNRKSIPYREAFTSSPFPLFVYLPLLPSHTFPVMVYILSPISSVSWFLFPPCCWLDSFRLHFVLNNPFLSFFFVTFCFGFLSIFIAIFSYISRCPKPILDTYNGVSPPFMFSHEDGNRTCFREVVSFYFPAYSKFVFTCLFLQLCSFVLEFWSYLRL